MNRWNTASVEQYGQYVLSIRANSSHPLLLWGLAWLLSWVSEVREGKPGRRRKRENIISIQMLTVHFPRDLSHYLDGLKTTCTSHKKVKREGQCVCVSMYDWCKGIKRSMYSYYSHISSSCRLHAINPAFPILQCSNLICECVGVCAYVCLHYRAALVR